MDFDEQQRGALDTALNEARFVGLTFDQEQSIAIVFLEVLGLPPEPDGRIDPRAALVLSPVGRVSATLKHGRWDDADAEVERLELDDLQRVAQRYGGHHVYGWRFFDPEGQAPTQSLDVSIRDEGGRTHAIKLSQEGESFLELQIWFDDLDAFAADNSQIPLDEFVGRGIRWWNGLYENDHRTAAEGIVPLDGGPGAWGAYMRSDS